MPSLWNLWEAGSGPVFLKLFATFDGTNFIDAPLPPSIHALGGPAKGSVNGVPHPVWMLFFPFVWGLIDFG